LYFPTIGEHLLVGFRELGFYSWNKDERLFAPLLLQACFTSNWERGVYLVHMNFQQIANKPFPLSSLTCPLMRVGRENKCLPFPLTAQT
jgi:hypothetical protein